MTSTIAQKSPRELIAMLRPEFQSPDVGAGAPGYNAEEGRIYWDRTNDNLYVNSNGAGAWQLIGGGGGIGGGGAANQVTYWTGPLTIAGDAGFTYNAATDTITLAGGITLTGGANATIIVNDNVADALGIEDAGGIEYLKLVTTNAQPITRFNDGGVDVDFYVEAVGVADALFIRGADGQITLGALGAGYVQSNAGGVLSVTATATPTAHAILSASHSDAAINAVNRGSIIVGNATPLWDELVHPGGANRVLQSTIADVQWSAQTLTLTTSLTNQGANGVLNWAGAFTLTIPATGTAVLGTGANTRVAYWTGVNTISGDAGFTYAAATDTITLAGGITLTGGANATIVVNDNVADALGIEDAGGIEYLKLVTTNAQPITRFNDGGVDVDFYVEAVGVADALFIRGADGQFTIGVLGAGFVQSTAGGVLSSAAIAAGDLPAHTHSGAGQGGSLVIGTTDTDATPGSLFFAGVAGVIQQDNANLFWDDTNNSLGIGINSPGNAHVYIYDNAIDTTATHYGLRIYEQKTAGATSDSDSLYGAGITSILNQSGGILNRIVAVDGEADLVQGTVDYLWSMYGRVQVTGGTVNTDIRGIQSTVNLDAGSIGQHVGGFWAYIDIEAGVTIAGDVYGIYIWGDVDTTPTGTVYGFYMDEMSGWDYGIYQNGTADNYLGGALGIGDITPDAPLDVYHATTDIVAFFESGDDIAGIKVEDDDTIGYLYVSDGDIYLGGDPAKGVTNLLIDVATGHMANGTSVSANVQSYIYNAAIDTTASRGGLYVYQEKTAGATNVSDNLRGIYAAAIFDQSGGSLGYIFGIDVLSRIDDGTASYLEGSRIQSLMAGGTSGIVYGGYFAADLDTGSVTSHTYGTYTIIDIEPGMTSVGGNVYGSYILVDDDKGASGTVYMLYLNEGSGIDYGLYQSGAADNYFGGAVGIGDVSPDAMLDVVVYDAVTTTITDVAILAHTTSGTAAVGFGAGLLYELEDDGGTLRDAGRLSFKWITAASATRRSEFIIDVIHAGGATQEIGVLVAPTGASVAGNPRGDGAVDFGSFRSLATEVASGGCSAIGGGYRNTVTPLYGVVSGGATNSVTGPAIAGAIGGGDNNTISGAAGTIAGGDTNDVNSAFGAICGGHQNTCGGVATGQYTGVLGGHANVASGDYASVLGGHENVASGDYSATLGGVSNLASGLVSVAMAYDAHATHSYSVVISATMAQTLSWANETFTARCHGGARFYSAAGVGTGVQLSAGGNAWAAISDRAVKENIMPAIGVLERLTSVGIYDYNLIAQPPDIRHIGPIAQEFNPAFGFTEDELRINVMDAIGISLAGVKELDARMLALERRISQLEIR